MALRFSCEKCAARVKTPDGTAGKRMRCPRCGHVQVVPDPSQASGADRPEPPAATEDALAQLAEAVEDVGPEVSPAVASPIAEPPEGVTDITDGPPVPAVPRVRPTPQPDRADPAPASAPIPLSAKRPRPVPRPGAGDTALLAASPAAAPGGSGMASAAAPDAPLPQARSRAEIRRTAARLAGIAWMCRLLSVVIAAGAVEIFLQARRQEATILTQCLLLAFGLATALVALAVSQLAGALRRQNGR